MFRLVLLFIGLALPLASPASTALDVQRAARELAFEVERARKAMGRSHADRPSLRITNALPREAYYVAMHLFRTADRFAFEQTRERLGQPKVVDASIRAADVEALIQASISRLRYANKHIGAARVDAQAVLAAPPPSRTQTAAKPNADTVTPGSQGRLPPEEDFSIALHALIAINRQLNVLLDYPLRSGEVYAQVTRAVIYSSRVLLHLNERRAIPSPPPFEAGKDPLDVRVRLLESFKKLRAVGREEGMAMLDLEPIDGAGAAHSARPGCAFELAALLVAQLEHINHLIGGGAAPILSPDPGRKFPSHVYQRAGILSAQLSTLESLSAANGGWLGLTPATEN